MELKHFELKFGKEFIQIPYYELIGSKPGRMGFVAGGIRGDDINSLNILRNFVRVAKISELEKKISGVLLIFPALNIPAVRVNSRFAPEDGQDLLKSFDGKDSSSKVTTRLAYELSHFFFKKCDFGITFVDSRSEFDYLPYGKAYSKEENIITNLEALRAFGTKIHIKTESKKKFMPIFLRDQFGTELQVMEIGSKKEISTEYVKSTMNGIRNILAFYKMLPDSKKTRAKQALITTKSYEKAKNSGILNLKVELGKEVKKGDKLGIIYDPINQKEFPIIASKSGFVYAKRNSNMIQEGQAVYYVLGK